MSVRVFFLDDKSRPDENHFVWAYQVTITNLGKIAVQLLRRTWHITDATGHTKIVHGEGVVGEQPVFDPGESFQYTSGTPLPTSSGFMVGTYHMVVLDSMEPFDIAIPAFSLDSPYEDSKLH